MSGPSRLMTPVGPVAAGFGRSRAFISGIMGPVGGGKTTECIAKGVRIGLMQKPVWDAQRGCHVKKCRGAIVRDTYPNLDRTVIKSWHQWFPKDLGRWSGEAPRTHAFTLDCGVPGTPGYHQLDMEVIFTAIGDKAVEDVLRGLELTWLWPNEWDLLPATILEIGAGRVGRYPSAMEGGCAWPFIFGDWNAPEEDNHVVSLFGIDGPSRIDAAMAEALGSDLNEGRPLIEFFRQPGGMDEGAENLTNLPGGRSYYTKQSALLRPDMKRRLIDNRVGPIRHGTPVFPEFHDDLSTHPTDPRGHVRNFEMIPGLPILIGADQGLLAAAALCQLDPATDTLRCFDELARVFEDKDGTIEVSQIGGEAFGRELKARLATRYPGYAVELVTCDPAGAAGEEAINHRSWRQDFAKGLGLPVRKARVPGNALEPRLKVVRDRVTGYAGGAPRLWVHPRCVVLRKAFNTKYAWRRVAVGSEAGGRFDSKPLKLQGYSDVMDALGYLAFEVERGVELGATGPASRGRSRRVVTNDSGMGARS